VSLKRNTSYNLIGALLPAIVALVTVPLYIPTIGTERFGALAIAWLVAGAFGFFDLGLTRATAYRVAALSCSNDSASTASALGTALVVGGTASLVASFLVAETARYYFAYQIVVGPTLRGELVDGAWLLGLVIPPAIVSAVFGGALQGHNRFFDTNMLSIGTTLVTQAAPLITALLIAADYSSLLWSIVIGRALLAVFAVAQATRVIAPLRAWRFDLNEARCLLTFGRWVMLTSIATPAILFADRFLIGSLISGASVALYNIPFQLAQRLALVPTAIAGATFPHMVAASPTRASELAAKATAYTFAAITGFTIALLFFLDPALALWLGSSIGAQIGSVAHVILLAFWANSLGVIFYVALESQGRPRVVTAILFAEIPFYFAALYFGAAHYGMLGAALAFALRCVIDSIILYRFARLPVGSFRSIVAQGIVVIVACVLSIELEAFTALWYGAAVICIITGGALSAMPVIGYLRELLVQRQQHRSSI
jgi:O-antigen/teichoic acid export membrane protein